MSAARVSKASAIGAALFVLAGTVYHTTRAQPAPDYAGTRPAPEFPAGLDWINTGGRELTLAQLRGRAVLLDFWTYGCINCMHIIPDLQRLQAKYGDALVVIGVHSAKFENEARTENIRRIAQRYGRDEPIVNDNEFTIWRSYSVRAWPTLMLIDPDGKVVGKLEGEGHYDTLDEVIGALIAQFERLDRIDRTPLGLNTVPEAERATPLLFPGGVAADAAADRLVVADTNHHRIVVTTLAGEPVATIGGGRGFADGDFADARFNGPQGVAFADADTLFVADTLNHSIRRIDLAGRRVTTVAGNGERRYLFDASYPARGGGLNSPWAVAVHRGRIYIAMAGQHQLWVLDPVAATVSAFAGTRREELRDGPRASSGFNQPSGLAVIGDTLYVADSEASAIRAVELGADGQVRTVVGTGLFDFGDVDGVGDAVRLQHPLGIAAHDGVLYVADTYNGAVKRLDPLERRVTTVWRGLSEPGGIAVAGDRLFVADTNAHEVRSAATDGSDARVVPIE